MKNKYFFWIFGLCFFVNTTMLSAFHGCPGIEINIFQISEASICGDAEFRVTIANNNTTGFTLQDFFIDLEPNSINEWITHNGITSTLGNFTMTGTGTSQGTVDANIAIPGQTVTYFDFSVSYACDFWDIVFNTNGAGLLGQEIIISDPPGNKDCYGTDNLTYDILYTLITPQQANPTVTTDLGDPFTLNLPLEVSGEYCDRDFNVTVDFPQCIDPSNAIFSLTDDVVGISIFLNTITPIGNSVTVNVSLDDYPGGGADLCYNEFTYEEGLGELIFNITNLKATCCGDGGGLPVDFSINACDDGADACSDNPTLDQITSSTIFVNIPNGGLPDINVSLDENASDNISVCANSGDQIELVYNVENAGSINAYDLDFDFYTQLDFDICNAFITYNGTTTYLLLSGNDQSIGTNINLLEDINCDGSAGELPPGASFTITIVLCPNYTCMFDDTGCATNINRRAYDMRLNWTNQCETLSPRPTASAIKQLAISSSDGYVDIQNSNLDDILEPGITYDMSLCSYGFNLGNLVNPNCDVLYQGSFSYQVAITSNYPNVSYGSLTLDNGTVIPPNGDGTYTIPSSENFSNSCMSIAFRFSCNDAPMEPIHFDFAISAVFDNCPDCQVSIGCAEVDFFTDCPGGTGGTGCEEIAGINGSIFNNEPGITGIGLSRAYPCDEVIISANGSLATNFNGNLGVCFGYQDDIPLVFGNDFSVVVNGPGGILGTFNTPPVVTNSNGINIYSWTIPGVTLNAGDQISYQITTNVLDDVIAGNVENLDLFVIGFGLNEVFCKTPANFTILEVETTTDIDQGGNCCTGRWYRYELHYVGGTVGVDFPGSNRVIGQFLGNTLGDISMSVDEGQIISIEDHTGAILASDCGNPTACTFSQNDIAPPNNKVSLTGLLQSIKIYYEAGCDNSAPNMTFEDFNYAENVYAGMGSDCYEIHQIADPNLSTGTVPDVVTAFEQNSYDVWSNPTTITVNTYTTNADACFPWIQIEYDPTYVDITYNGVLNQASSNDGTKAIIAVELGFLNNWDDAVATDFDISFLPGACDNQPLELNLYASHACFTADGFNLEANCNTELDCVDSDDQALITILDSDLTVTGIDCTPDAGPCEVHYYSFVLTNNGQANTNDIVFTADLPAGYTITEASFIYPFSGDINDCNAGTTIADPSLITSGGWEIQTPDPGTLPGIASGATNAERNFYIQVGIIGSCNLDPSDLTVAFEAAGVQACGDPITAPFEFELPPNGGFIVPDVNITVSDNYDCYQGVGTFSFEIDFLIDDLDIPAGQQFKLFLNPGNGIGLTCEDPIIFDYDDQTVTCNYLLKGADCGSLFDLEWTLVTCYEFYCGKELCEFSETIGNGNYQFVPYDQWVYFSDVEFDEAFCNANSTDPANITVTLNNNSADPGTSITVQLYCDENENGILDPGEPLLTSTTTTVPSGSSTVTLTMTPEEFNEACGSGHVIVTAVSLNQCLCIRDAAGELCCPCPEWEVSYEFLDENIIGFTITSVPPGLTPECIDVYIDGVYISNHANVNEFIQLIPEGAKEICLYIYSEQIGNDCEGEFNSPMEIKSDLKKKCEAPCVQEWCLPLQQCMVEANFGLLLVPNPSEDTYDLSTFEVTQTNGTIISFEWTINGVVFGNGPEASITDLEAGTYEICLTVIAQMPSGLTCEDTFCDIIEIDTKMLYTCDNYHVAFTYQDLGRSTYQFNDATRSLGHSISYNWTVDGRTVSTDQNFSYTFPANGFYRVVLTVESAIGDYRCIQSYGEWITVGGKGDGETREAQLDTETSIKGQVSSIVIPNPSHSLFQLQVTPDPLDDQLSIDLYNINGTKISEKQVQVEGKQTISVPFNLEEQPNGLYHLIIRGEHTYLTNKVLKQE